MKFEGLNVLVVAPLSMYSHK